MTTDDLLQHLHRLNLLPGEAAQLLGVAPRTVHRWLEGEDVSGPAEQALRAWLRLRDYHLAWRPDSQSIIDNHQERIASHLTHSIDLNGLLDRVEARGGDRLAWAVDMTRCNATLGPMEVSFYKLRNGSFSPASYRRTDGKEANLTRDWDLIEEAFYCIAMELRREPSFGPVTLVHHTLRPRDGVANQSFEDFASNRAAMARAFELLTQSKTSEPFIQLAGSPARQTVLWTARDLAAAYERSKNPDFSVSVLSPGEYGVSALSERARKAYRLKAGHALVFKGCADLLPYIEHAKWAGFSFVGEVEAGLGL